MIYTALKVHAQTMAVKFMNKWSVVLGMYLATIFVGGGIYTVVEEGKTWVDGWWWAFITSMSIGYGDQFPVTGIGRATGVVVGVVGIWFVIPVIVVLLLQSVIQDMHKLTDLEQRLLMASARADIESDKVASQDNEILYSRQALIMEALVKISEGEDLLDTVRHFQNLKLPFRDRLYELWSECDELEEEERRETASSLC